MTVNQSARNVRLLIGGTDYTPCLISFQGSDSHLDQSGLITYFYWADSIGEGIGLHAAFGRSQESR